MIESSLSIETIKSKRRHTTTKSVKCQGLDSRSSHIKLAIYFNCAYVSYTGILSTICTMDREEVEAHSLLRSQATPPMAHPVMLKLGSPSRLFIDLL